MSDSSTTTSKSGTRKRVASCSGKSCRNVAPSLPLQPQQPPVLTLNLNLNGETKHHYAHKKHKANLNPADFYTISIPDVQIIALNSANYNYCSVLVHKQEGYIVLWDNKNGYEGLDAHKRYSIVGLPDGAMFTGDNAHLLDHDQEIVPAQFGPHNASSLSGEALVGAQHAAPRLERVRPARGNVHPQRRWEGPVEGVL